MTVTVLRTLCGAPHALRRWLPSGATLAFAGLAMASIAAWNVSFCNDVSGILARVLERRFARTELVDPAGVTGLVVLGGGEERLREAGRLARLHAHLKLHVSGAGEPEFVWRILGDGIRPGRVSIETLSRNTFENAVNSRRLVDPKPGERWLLVTSAMHMPRSVGAFRKVGFGPEAWPVDDRVSGVGAVVREWTALLWYWIRGWSGPLLPGASS